MATTATTADQIQAEMRQVRTELRADVREIVEGARVMADWRHYVRQYPWLTVGVAAAVGYFLVPARPVVIKPSSKDLIELAKAHKLFVDASPRPQQRPGMLGSLAGMAMSAVMQSAMAVASHHLDQFLKGLGERPPPPRPGERQ